MSRHFVLVVEDDVDIREALMDSLSDHGWEAIGAANGAAALQYLASADALPCLVLLDLMMPIMDGHGFREAQLRDARLAHIPVVVLTAFRDAQERAQNLKAAAFLTKPTKVEDVMAVVGQHC